MDTTCLRLNEYCCIVLVLALALPLHILGSAPSFCKSYDVIEGRNRVCASRHLPPSSNGRLPGSSTQLLDWINAVCTKADSYIDCMDKSFWRCGPELVDFAGAEARNYMNFCNGTGAADWIKGLAPMFDVITQQCLSGPDTFSKCSLEEDTLLQYMTENKESPYDGVAAFQTLTGDLLVCVFKGMREMNVTSSGCRVGSTWRENYVGAVTWLLGLSQERPLGVYLTDDIIEFLQWIQVEAVMEKQGGE